jgi:hypothetical protein
LAASLIAIAAHRHQRFHHYIRHRQNIKIPIVIAASAPARFVAVRLRA